MEPVSLGDLVSDALAAAQPVATAKDLRLHGRMDGPVELDGSAPELSRVLGNLLDNAIRETPPGGRRAMSRRIELPIFPSRRRPRPRPERRHPGPWGVQTLDELPASSPSRIGSANLGTVATSRPPGRSTAATAASTSKSGWSWARPSTASVTPGRLAWKRLR